MRPARRRSVARALLALLLAAGSVAALVPGLPAVATAQTPPRPVPAPFVAAITDAGFVPPSITLAAGQVLLVDNQTAVEQTFTAADGWIDSGPIPPGGRFVLGTAAGTFGGHDVASTTTPAFTARVQIGLLDLPGTSTTSVGSSIPSGWVRPSAAIDTHPRFGILAARNRAVVTFVPTARVTAANAALARAGVVVVGGNTRFGLVVVEVPDTGDPGDFAAIDAAIATLRADASVRTAVLDVAMGEPARVPGPEDPPYAEGTGDREWKYQLLTTGTGSAAGQGSNHGIESMRMPQAWNLLGSLSNATSTAPDVVLIDTSFQAGHPEAVVTVDDLCDGDICSGFSGGDHGTAMATLIAAPVENRGVEAAGPLDGPLPPGLGNVHVVGLTTLPDQPGTFTDVLRTLELVLANRSARFPRLKVIDIPLAGLTFGRDAAGRPSAYLERNASRRCGPGANDDGTNPSEPCHPGNDDAFLDLVTQIAETYRPAVTSLANSGVLLVVAAGNDSGPFTLANGTDRSFCLPYLAPDCTSVTMPSAAVQPLARLARNWGAGTPPILVVESSTAIVPFDGSPIEPSRDPFSNTGGDISAPGYRVLSGVFDDEGNPTWTNAIGTSASSAYVAGVAGYLAALAPTASVAALRSVLVTSANNDTIGGAPRIDAYAAAMGLTGSTTKLVDVNDPSADGNARVFRDEDGFVLGEFSDLGPAAARTDDRDGAVDIRDFRRYRDAWLQMCAANENLDAECPGSSQIVLDGIADNPHFDGNLDGCFQRAETGSCDVPEWIFSRFDFNGDGTLATRSAPVPISPTTGAPTVGLTTNPMTDLEVLASVWGTGTAADTQGWTRADLPLLRLSADVTVLLDRLFDAGPTSVDLHLETIGGVSSPTVRLTSRSNFEVLSVPLVDAADGQPVQLVAVANFAGAPSRAYISPPVTLRLGQDTTMRPCVGQGTLVPDRADLQAGERTLVTFTYGDCTDEPDPDVVGGLPMTFSVTGPGTLADADVETNDTGEATVALVAGSEEGEVEITAQSVVGGIPVVARATVTVRRQLTVWYRFRQTNLEYDRTATNDWNDVADDCDEPGDPNAAPGGAGCFTSTMALDDFFADASTGFVREGSLRSDTDGTGAVLDERIRHFERGDGGGWAELILDHTSTRTSPTGATVTNETEQAFRLPFPNEIDDGVDWYRGYEDEPLPDTSLRLTGTGLEIDALGAVGGLEYPYVYRCTPLAGSNCQNHRDDVSLRNPLRELLAADRLDGSSLQYGDDPTAPLRFTRNPDGTYQTYSYCGVIDRNFAATVPGYWNDADEDADRRYAELRSLTRGAGDRAAPIYTGNLTARLEFVAVVTDGTPPTDEQLAFPTCTANRADLRVGLADDPVREGTEVGLVPLALGDYPGATYSWTFEDGSPAATGPNPVHTWADDGVYEVTVTRTLPDGTVDRATRDVAVVNMPPFIVVARATNGAPPIVEAEIGDLGTVDELALTVAVTSTTPGFVPPATRAYPSGPVRIALPTQPPGLYALQLVVTDKDGLVNRFAMDLFVPGAGTGGGGPGSGATAGLAAVDRAPTAATTAAPTGTGAAPKGAGRVAAPAAPAALDARPVAAFVLPSTSAGTGSNLLVRNASRAAGVGIAATFDPGDGRPALPLAPGATAAVAYLAAGVPTTTLTTTGSTTASATSPLSVTGATIDPTITYTGPTASAQGQIVAASTRYAAGATGLGGFTVRATLGPNEATAVTDADGIARPALTVPGPSGVRSLVAAVAAVGAVTARSVSTSFTVGSGSAPTAEAGGPYELGPDGTVALAASAVDPDLGQEALLDYRWDLDLDGAYDDATGAAPSVTWAEAQGLVCGGTCELGQVHEVAVLVTDPDGATDDDRAEIRIQREFTLTVTPTSGLLVPGAAVNFQVTVGTTSGFDQPVAITVQGLPATVSSSFFTPAGVSNRLLPGEVGLLSVKASNTAPEQAFTLTVVGTAGGLVRTVPLTFDVEFGLIPQCTGAVAGRVTDLLTGAGIAGVRIGTTNVTTGADGSYRATGVAVSADNGPRQYSATLNANGYHEQAVSYRVACGITTRADFTLAPRQTAFVEGTVYSRPAGQPGPLTPLAGARYNGTGTPTDATGGYRFGIELPKGRTTATTDALFTAPGHHNGSTNTLVTAGQTTAPVDVVLEQRCLGSVLVRVLDSATNQPVPNARVIVGTSSERTADAGGRVVVDTVSLGPDAAAVTVQVRARGPVNGPVSDQPRADVTIPACGMTVPVDMAVTFPREILATVENRVVDDETGLPIPGATISVSSLSFSFPGTPPPTDASGVSTFVVRLGFGSPTTRNVNVAASMPGYLRVPSNPTFAVLNEGQTTVVTHRLQRQRFSAVEGVVRDAVTGEPIAGANVDISGQSGGSQHTVGDPVTGPDGRFRFENIGLGLGGSPVSVELDAREIAGEYWRAEVRNVSVGPDGTTQDILMTPVCTGATIRGRVVNAVTRDPIGGARVSTTGRAFTTSSDGLFVLTDVPVADGNEPRQVFVTAAAVGFVTATKSVTVFCGADIVLDFGNDQDGTGTIVGTVRDESGDPVVGAFVGTGFGGADTTDAQGAYSISGAPAGTGGGPRDWPVRVTPPAASGLGTASATATVRRDETTTLDFTLGELGNTAPVANDVEVSSAHGTAVAVTLDGFDADGDDLAYAVEAPDAAEGTLTGTAPSLTFTPAVGFAGEATFTYTVSDGTATSPPATVTVTVAEAPNEVPVAVLVVGSAAPEGGTVSLSASGSTDGDGSIASYAWDLDDDGAFDDATGATASIGADDDGDVPVAVQVTDDEGATDVAEGVASFTNADPTATIDAVSVSPAGLLLGGGSYDDPGTADTHTATVDWGEGDGPEPLDLEAGTFALVHEYAEDGAFEVTVEVCDDDGGCAVDTVGVEVDRNEVPVARIAPVGAAIEGAVVALDASASGDPDGDIESFAWDLDGDGAFDDGSGPTATVQRLDDATVTVAVQVTDDGGATATAARVVVFANAAPTVGIDGGDAETGADGRFTTTGSFTDASPVDTHLATVDWGEGGGVETLALSGRSFTLDHGFARRGTYAVTVRVCDDDDGCDSATVEVVVPNRVPTATPRTVSTPADEAVSITLDGTDADADTLTFAIAGGPASGSLTGDGATRTYTPAPDAVPGTVTFTYTASDGQATSAPATVTVNLTAGNAPPEAAVSGATSAVEGGSVVLTDASSDPDGSVTAVAWDLDGDGTFETAGTPAGTVTATRTGDGTLTVGLRATDDDGATGTTTHVVTFTNGPPTVALADDLAVTGSRLHRTGTAADPGTGDVLTATVDWGDGQGAQPLPLDGEGGFDLDHVYDTSGPASPSSVLGAALVPVNVTVRVCDDADACGEASFAATVGTADPADEADLGVTIDVGDSHGIGDESTYVVRVANGGPDAATSVVVVVALPDGVVPLGADGPAGWTCTVDATARTARCERAGALAVGAEELEVDVRFTVAGAALVASATVSAATTDPGGGDDRAEVTTAVLAGGDASTTTTTTVPSSGTTTTTGSRVLARSGATTGAQAFTGTALVAAGAALVLAMRRRRLRMQAALARVPRRVLPARRRPAHRAGRR